MKLSYKHSDDGIAMSISRLAIIKRGKSEETPNTKLRTHSNATRKRMQTAAPKQIGRGDLSDNSREISNNLGKKTNLGRALRS